ncbi:Aste57867_9065 [Aphanomyces stellatus]|uniref:Aste57867_9065 protein n=1 Tax=Aphanomyces stellatus TaxID=120398 RepID=A0A485KMA2_9STRA|nr:hypothetical protein As57867_009029 [Aphanomyces stellatus]VFT85949.1 Aste57867_9065 [Aphanomyces stellatus]
MPLPSKQWLCSLMTKPFQKKNKSQEQNKPEAPRRSFLSWRRKSTVSVQDDEETTQDETEKATAGATQNTAQAAWTTVVPSKKVQVPVLIPLEHMYCMATFVGGKKIPYTRLQTKQGRRRMIVYERIHEDKPFYA